MHSDSASKGLKGEIERGIFFTFWKREGGGRTNLAPGYTFADVSIPGGMV